MYLFKVFKQSYARCPRKKVYKQVQRKCTTEICTIFI